MTEKPEFNETNEEVEAKAMIFMRQVTQHISNASDAQKDALRVALLNYPTDTSAINLAEEIFKGLTEEEFMVLCKRLQSYYDKAFWEFAVRWR